MTYDIESLLADVKKILVCHLNNHIAAIEAEKVQAGFVATNIQPVDPDNGYIEQSLADVPININPCLVYGVDDIGAVSQNAATAQTVKLFVAIVIVDNGMDTLAKNKIHRYTRAAKEVFEKHFDRIRSASLLKIETFLPVSFKMDENSSETMKIGGVSITTSIA